MDCQMSLFEQKPAVAPATAPLGTIPELASYDIILVSTSGGKDSQAMLSVVCELAEAAGVKDRVVTVHADLGRIEWDGVKDLAEKQAAFYGVPFHVVKRPQGDFLQMTLDKHERNQAAGKVQPPWSAPHARDCTKAHKVGQIYTLMTALVRKVWAGVKVRILDCQGLRSEESVKREKQPQFKVNTEATNKNRRHVDTWLPIKDWTTAQVWERIDRDGAPHHWAYDVGMPRLSCCFCFFAVFHGKPAAEQTLWLLAGYYNRELLEAYIEVEEAVGYTYVQGLHMSEIRDVLDAGWEPPKSNGRNVAVTWRD